MHSDILTRLKDMGRDKVESLPKIHGVITDLALIIEENATHYIYTKYKEATHPDGCDLKLGQITKDSRHVIERIAEQDGTSTSEPLILIAALHIPLITDHQLRSHIGTKGYKFRPDKKREWIRNILPEDAVNLIREYTNQNHDSIYYARPHAIWASAKILDRYNSISTSLIVPADLCPRFGKTLFALDLFNQIGFNVMICSAHWLSAHSSFKNTINKFDISQDIEYITVKAGCVEEAVNLYKVARTAGRRVFLALSLHADGEKLDNFQPLLDIIREEVFIFQDEADFGAHTDSRRAVLKPFMNNGYKNLLVFGTGSNISRACIGSNEYIGEFYGRPLTVDYVDLLNVKHGEGFLFDNAFIGDGPLETSALAKIRANKEIYMNRLKDITELNYAHLELSPEIVQLLSQANPEVVPTMAKLLENRNIAQGKAFLKCLFGDESAGELNFENINAQIRGGWTTDFPVVGLFIGGNEQITPIENAVKCAQKINPDWKFVPLHGKVSSNEDAEDYINQEIAIAKRESLLGSSYEGLVFVSAGVGSRSFSIPNIEMVIRMIDGGSNATAVQQSLRTATPSVDKNDALIVDICINRDRISGFTSMLISHAVRESKHTGQSLNQVYNRLVNGTISFWKQKNGAFVHQDNTDLIYEIKAAFQDPDTVMSRINWDNVFESELKDIILKIKTSSDSDTESKKLLNTLGKTLVSQPKNTKTKTLEELEKIRLIKALTTLVRSVGNLYTLVPEARSFISALEVVASNKYKSSDYKFDTGISASEAIKLADADFFAEGDLDMILHVMQETKEIPQKCYVYEKVPRKNVEYWNLFSEEFIFVKGKTICVLLDTIEDMNYIESMNPNWVNDNDVYIVCARGHGEGYVDTFDPEKYQNVISGKKFLEGGLDYMKFDVYGINPPYNVDKNPNYYIRFIKKGKEVLKNNGIMAFIIPNRFLDPQSSAGKWIHSFIEMDKVFPDVKHYFPSIGSNVAAFIGRKVSNPQKKDIEYTFTKTGDTIVWNPSNPMPIQATNLKSALIVNKVFNKDGEKLITKKKPSSKNFTFIEMNYIRFCHTKPKGGKKALSTVVNGNIRNGEYIDMNTKEEAELNSWFLSKSLIGRFCIYCFANAPQVSWRCVKRMPKLNGLEMTDDALFEYFGITEEEQKHILNEMVNVKEQS